MDPPPPLRGDAPVQPTLYFQINFDASDRFVCAAHNEQFDFKAVDCSENSFRRLNSSWTITFGANLYYKFGIVCHESKWNFGEKDVCALSDWKARQILLEESFALVSAGSHLPVALVRSEICKCFWLF